MPTELLLAIALVAVYLFDSTHFLRVGETLVLARGRRLSGLSFGGSFELGGRRPYLPNPLLPLRLNFRVSWDISGGATDDARAVGEQMRQHLMAARPVGWIATVCAIPIVLVAPFALALHAELIFLGAVAASVLSAACGCVIVALRRKDLGLNGWQVCSVIFVALICLPCAPNLARAVTLYRKWNLAARDLPQLGFDPSHADTIRGQIVAALSSAKRYVAEESAEFKVIDEQLRQLGGCNP
jgi:hypothetical protein